VKARQTYTYSLYGLRLKSEWAIPCHERAEPGLPVVELFEGSAAFFTEMRPEAVTESGDEKWHWFVRLANGCDYLRWSRHFEFLVSADGHRITGRPLDHASWQAFHTYLLGQVLSHAMLKQGIEPLHSTVFVIDGAAVAVIGDSGYGKSTLAAAFLQAGYPLLTDDLLILKEEGNGFSAYPGLPRIKLFPEIATTLFGEHIRGTPMNRLTPKLIIPLDHNQSYRATAVLKAIYLLGRGATGSRPNSARITRLPQRRAFLELVKNTYNRDVIQPWRLKCQFDLATKVASRVPVKLLSYPRILASLPSVREAIFSDLRR
jgi:hypothetical protein